MKPIMISNPQSSAPLGTLLLCVSLLGCSTSQEAAQVSLPVVVSSASIAPMTTDLGYTVTITNARVAIEDLLFTVEGEEQQESAIGQLWNWLVPEAHAHPGHQAGGVVTGELLGEFVIDWMSDGPLGTANLLSGSYQAINFSFRTATEGQLEPSDPLIGHTVHVQGVAVKSDEGGDETIPFDMLLYIEPETLMLGGIYQHEVTATTQATLSLEFLTIDPYEGDSVFDGIDFASIARNEQGHVVIAPGMAEHNIARRTFQIHDHYRITVQ